MPSSWQSFYGRSLGDISSIQLGSQYALQKYDPKALGVVLGLPVLKWWIEILPEEWNRRTQFSEDLPIGSVLKYRVNHQQTQDPEINQHQKNDPLAFWGGGASPILSHNQISFPFFQGSLALCRLFGRNLWRCKNTHTPNVLFTETKW